ncbi:MAG TPA: type IV pilus twitching motility protein PilT [Candidatus Methylacidiphilales bacterium]|jgi:twitching motility protein PilT|nr:type IV pilus twitching motility protein PilT [Candidatus Methylacidiphilales bacterium]
MSEAATKPRILIDQFFDIIVESKASDLHMQEGQPPKMRLHGDIQAIRNEPLTRAEMQQMLSEVVGPKRWEKFEESGDLDCAYELNADSRFRCNLHKHLHGYGGIFRLIPNKIATLEQLKVPTVIKRFANVRGGLVLVTGPTGSGKSTTLAALIDFINSSYSRHIITIEEPIEFVHPNKLSIITQREVGEDTPSFAEGLKNAMREDADVVLVGEMRDLETIALALTAAETGMLVFGTLHTNNARKTVDRMIDVFPSSQQPQVRTMLSASLRGIVAQLLLKKSDGKGRVAVNEILISNNAVSSIIREGAVEKLTDVLISGKAEGMQFMDDAINTLLQNGTINAHEAYMKAIDKGRFAPFLEGSDANIAAIANSGGKNPPKPNVAAAKTGPPKLPGVKK